jgi:hypothetical protein
MMRHLFRWFNKPKPPADVTPSPPQPRQGWPLDEPMIRLTPWDFLSTRDLLEGTLIIGNTGSGKSSTSGTIIAMAALRAGWGIAVYAAKPGDAAYWEDLCRKTGRLHDLRIVRPGGTHHFNMMLHELSRDGPVGQSTLRLARLLTQLLCTDKRSSVESDASRFFDQMVLVTLTNVLDIMVQAREPIGFDSIQQFLNHLPKSAGELEDERWLTSYAHQLLARADRNVAASGTPDDARLHASAAHYFLDTMPHMSDRTQGDVLSSITAEVFQLSRSPFRELLDSPRGCNFTPDMLNDGAILLYDCTIAEWGPIGKALMQFQKSINQHYLRRRPAKGDHIRPVLLFGDEGQQYVTRDDADFQNICRDQRVASVFLTQSISNLEAELGNDAFTNSLANSLTNLIVHCTVGSTAEWVQARIAQAWRQMESTSYSGWSSGQSQSPGVNVSESIHPQILASELTRLRTGGVPHGNLVDALVFKPGRKFVASGLPFVRVQFRQE